MAKNQITNPDHPDHPLHGLANERKARERWDRKGERQTSGRMARSAAGGDGCFAPDL